MSNNQNTKDTEVAETAKTPSQKDEQEVSTDAVHDPTSINNFINRAIDNDADMDTLERLFELQKEVKAEQAKERFNEAMSQFQANCPEIEKHRTVEKKDGTVIYRYAPLGDIVQIIKQPLGEAGLSYSWDTSTEKSGNTIFVNAEAVVTHKAGHKQSTAFSVPVEQDPDSMQSAPQEFGTALTYAKRYALTSALGIATADEDIDAVKKQESEAKSPKSEITILLRNLDYKPSDMDGEKVKEVVKDETNLELKPENFSEIINRLQVLLSEKQADDSNPDQ